MKTFEMDNNESVSVGIVPQADGTYLALTFASSKKFKTRKGAEKWLAKRGFAPTGATRSK